MAVSGRNFFYKRITVSNNTFDANLKVDFGFQASKVMIVNDHPEATLSFSFRVNATPNLDGELFGPADGPLAFDNVGEGRMWFHKDADDEDIQVRVWAWRGGTGK